MKYPFSTLKMGIDIKFSIHIPTASHFPTKKGHPESKKMPSMGIKENFCRYIPTLPPLTLLFPATGSAVHVFDKPSPACRSLQFKKNTDCNLAQICL